MFMNRQDKEELAKRIVKVFDEYLYEKRLEDCQELIGTTIDRNKSVPGLDTDGDDISLDDYYRTIARYDRTSEKLMRLLDEDCKNLEKFKALVEYRGI